MKKIKICKDCQYFKKGWFDEIQHARCTRSVLTNKVSGENIYNFCSIERDHSYDEKFCGPKGKHYKPKK